MFINFNNNTNNNSNNNNKANLPKYTWENINLSKKYVDGETKLMVIFKFETQEQGKYNYIFIPKNHIRASNFSDNLRIGIAKEKDYRIYFSLGKDQPYNTVKGSLLIDNLKK